MELARGLDVEAEQPREGQVDLLHLVEVQLVAQAADAIDLVGGERLLGLPPQRGPGLAVELDVRRAVSGCCSMPAGMCRNSRLRPMCGIVGYVGGQQAHDVVIEGLRRLEYRGYDSAGIALVDGDGSIASDKRAGKLANLEKSLEETPLPAATTGIGHTRWATHGAPNDVNAHPHAGQGGRVALVHNGIIENFAGLRDELERAGHDLRSETDTEVAAHLLENGARRGAGPHRRRCCRSVPSARRRVHARRRRRPGPFAGGGGAAQLATGGGPR